MSIKSLVKSTGIISAATAISRILGFVRDILIANFFGTGQAIQAFLVAFRIPNLLRHIVAEGAASSAVVPVLSEYLAKEKKDYWHLVNILLNIILIVLLSVVVIGILSAPFVVRIIAPGFVSDYPQYRLAVRLTKIIFPYILLIGISAYFMGVLNTHRHFAVPAIAPIFLNISLIGAILVYSQNINVTILAFAVLVGGGFQVLIQVPVLYRKGLRLKRPISLYHKVVKKMGLLLLPRILGAAVYQLNVVIDTILASLYWIVGNGGIAALWFSNRIIQLPTAVLGTSLATASLPTLSSHFTRGDTEAFKETINFLLKALLLVMIPASVGIMVLGNHIVRILFQRGEFTVYSTEITNTALFFYAFGLFSYPGIKIMVYSFYSMQDTVTPVKTALLSLLVNTILNLILMWPLRVGGLALATSIAGIFNFIALFCILRNRIGHLDERGLIVYFGKTILAALVMGGILYSGLDRFSLFFSNRGFLVNLLGLFIYIIYGVVIYLCALYLLRVRELGRFARWILKRR